MNLGFAFVVTVAREESEERLLQVLKRRHANYPIIRRDPSAWIEGGILPARAKYPADWLISSLDGHFLTLSAEEAPEIEGLGLVIRPATPDDLGRILP